MSKYSLFKLFHWEMACSVRWFKTLLVNSAANCWSGESLEKNLFRLPSAYTSHLEYSEKDNCCANFCNHKVSPRRKEKARDYLSSVKNESLEKGNWEGWRWLLLSGPCSFWSLWKTSKEVKNKKRRKSKDKAMAQIQAHFKVDLT